MKEVQVKTYYKNYLANEYILVHQYANLLENESVILRGPKKETSMIVAHKNNEGIIYSEMDTEYLDQYLKEKELEKALESNGFPSNYVIIKGKLDFENVFVSNDDNDSVKITLSKDDFGSYWEDEVCQLKKALDQEICL